MSIQVSFMPPGALGSRYSVGIGAVRRTETISLNAKSSAAKDGEVALLFSTEASTIDVAHGKNPDATLTDGTGDSTARYPLAAGQYVMVACAAGDKFHFAAFS